ncbi:hypothetical protein [Gloeothece verrucosa]|uniref:Uncharacterized protein n=1 Tax=Gloeothece verrucosa (strain PCC 7822) TaxID=497965 RepID=E0UCA6_GLOV7|nr:hypothetical protein [Gloeothece verrucosa]ADN12863.1 hypothetical protein Cyan7822_0843 [Gloeothece verrucosa PCC 7822]
MPQIRKAKITMSVEALIIDQEDGLNPTHSQLVLGDFLQNQIYFPPYSLVGEANEFKFDIELKFLKKSAKLIDIELTNV